jgi:uncharacterized membrane protein YfcA
VRNSSTRVACTWRDDNLVGFDLLLVFIAFLTAVIDIIFGMGFGLTMTPILLFLNYTPKEIVPALLLSSLVGNILSSYFNHRLGNADFSPGGHLFKLVMIIGIVGMVGSLIGAVVNTGISNFYLGLYIGSLITGSGLFLLLNKTMSTGFSWAKIVLLSLFGSFNKGISGSGFGPIITTGMLYMKIKEKEAVSVQSFAELFVSLVGFITFIVSGAIVNWDLTLSLFVGVAASAPVASFIVNKSGEGTLRSAIAIVTIILGVATLVRLFV